MSEILSELRNAREEMNFFEEKLEADYENAELEAKCDKAYERYYGIAQEVARKIVLLAGGNITFQTAIQMVHQKSNELQKIFNWGDFMCRTVLTEEIVENVYSIVGKISKSDIESLFDGFLLEDRPTSEYEYISKMFNDFINVNAEGREIKELTKSYRELELSMNDLNISPKENNQLLYLIFDVATKAEMQGFIYGVKIFGLLLGIYLKNKGGEVYG